jgi:hypothetical protein
MAAAPLEQATAHLVQLGTGWLRLFPHQQKIFIRAGKKSKLPAQKLAAYPQ